MAKRQRAPHLQVVQAPSSSLHAAFVEAHLETVTEHGVVVVKLSDGAVVEVLLGIMLSDQLLLEATRQRRAVMLARIATRSGERWVLTAVLREGISAQASTVRGDGPPQAGVAAIAGHLELEAESGLTLGCGEASIELRADGRIALRGRDILVSSSGNATLQGATVKVN